MALKPSDRYPAQIDTDVAYPFGKARNAGSFQDGTGTPLEKDLVNDLFGMQQALLVAASLEPSGTPDSASVSQYLEAVRRVSLGVDLRSRLALRRLDQLSSAATGSLSGAVTKDDGIRSLVVRTGSNGVFVSVGDSSAVGSVFSTVPTLTAIGEVARGGGRVLVVGDGGTNNYYSTDEGSSWIAGGSLGGTPYPIHVIWDGTEFIAIDATGSSYHSTNGAVWTTTSGVDIEDALGYTANRGLALLADGTVVCASGNSPFPDETPKFVITTDHAVNWSLAGSIPSSDYGNDSDGLVYGNGGDEIYWLGRTDPAADRLDLWVSTDAITWTKRAELGAPFGDNVPFALHDCQETGLLVISQDVGIADALVTASIDGGHSWCEPVRYPNLRSFAVSNGRLFAGGLGAGTFATDRIL
jgi:hypothetical protein